MAALSASARYFARHAVSSCVAAAMAVSRMWLSGGNVVAIGNIQ